MASLSRKRLGEARPKRGRHGDYNCQMLSGIRDAVRLLLRSPAFACTAILTLALGIGANSAVFTVLNSVVLKPLPFPEPDRIVRIRGHNELHGWTGGSVTMPDIDDFRAQSSKYLAVAGYGNGTRILTGHGPAQALEGPGVRGDFFAALGVQPRLGRAFLEDEFAPGAEPAVVLSDRTWRRVFEADPSILNSVIMLDGEPNHIVGIMAADFQFPDQAELWVSTPGDRSVARGRSYATTTAIARLKPGVTIGEARSETAAIASRIAGEHPNSHRGFSTSVVTLAEDRFGGAREVLQLFLAAAVCVLLIACSNVANLMLARAAARGRELAIRAALGASSVQLFRQTLFESLCLALAGAAIGLVLAQAALRALVNGNAQLFPRAGEIRLDPAAVAYTILVALLTSVLFGSFPAFSILKTDVQRALGDRAGVQSSSSSRTRAGLVVSQFAMATMLACSAGLLLKTFQVMVTSDPGYQTRRILLADIALADPGYRTNLTRAYTLYRDALVAIGGLPGVELAGAATSAPLGSLEFHRQVGRAGADARQKVATALVGASVDYHKAMGIPLRSGRYFAWGDSAVASRYPVLLSESLAKNLFANADPIGRAVAFGATDSMEVVGVVGDIRSASLDQPPQAHLYLPLDRSMMRFATLAIRSNLPPNQLTEAVRRELALLDPNVPLLNVRTIEEAADRNLSGPRFRTILLTSFAGTALLLSIVGIYGLLSYAVERRYPEMGVRIALGASTFAVGRLIVGQGLRMAAAGVAIGLLAAFALGKAIGGLIYGIEPLDPVLAVVAGVIFLLAGAGASLAPALRAARADPLEILRHN